MILWEEGEPCQNSSNRTIPTVDTQYKIISKWKDDMLWNLLNNIRVFVIYSHAVGLKVKRSFVTFLFSIIMLLQQQAKVTYF